MKPIKPTLIERGIALVAPARALRHMQDRVRFEMITGGHTGGRRDRRGTKNWLPGGGSAEADTLPDLATLRERSRDLARNAPLAGAALNRAVTAVVGPGLRLQPRVNRKLLGLTDAAADEWELQARAVWNEWAGALTCDITRQQRFKDLQSLALRGKLESGDIFFVKRFEPALRGARNTRFAYCLQAVEADRVANPGFKADGAALDNGNTVSGGVERDAHGAPVAFHVLRSHPGDTGLAKSRESDRIAAFGRDGRRAVIHLFDKTRPGLPRGVPYLAPVIESLKELDRYTEAERAAAVVGAMFAVFVKSDSGAGLAPGSGQAGDSDTDTGYDELTLGNGMIAKLAPGDDISVAAPGRPNGGFDQFVMAISRQVAAVLEQPVEVIWLHFTASYSASRAALLAAWKYYNRQRAWLAEELCQDVYVDVLSEAVARGFLAAPGFLEDPLMRLAWSGAQWIGPAMGQIDPLKEVDAAAKRIEARLSTRERETAELTGEDWEDTADQLASEQRRMEAQGIAPALGAREVGEPAKQISPPDEPDAPDDADRREREETAPAR
jgi:lambda family phage portal protein